MGHVAAPSTPPPSTSPDRGRTTGLGSAVLGLWGKRESSAHSHDGDSVKVESSQEDHELGGEASAQTNGEALSEAPEPPTLSLPPPLPPRSRGASNSSVASEQPQSEQRERKPSLFDATSLATAALKFIASKDDKARRNSGSSQSHKSGSPGPSPGLPPTASPSMAPTDSPRSMRAASPQPRPESPSPLSTMNSAPSAPEAAQIPVTASGSATPTPTRTPKPPPLPPRRTSAPTVA